MTPAQPVTWSDLSAEDLDVGTLYDVLALRSAVFVVEQECAYQDPDGLDLLAGTRHLLGRRDGIAAYARLLAPDVGPDVGPGTVVPASERSSSERSAPRIGRVIVNSAGRGQQLGRRLMERAIASCEQHWPGQPIELGAQAHLTGFYRSLGFETVGEPYIEDGIPHVHMRRLAG